MELHREQDAVVVGEEGLEERGVGSRVHAQHRGAGDPTRPWRAAAVHTDQQVLSGRQVFCGQQAFGAGESTVVRSHRLDHVPPGAAERRAGLARDMAEPAVAGQSALVREEPGTVLVGYGAVEELTGFAATPGWTVHVPGRPAEVRRAVPAAVAGGERAAYIHVCADSYTEPRGATDGFERVREGLDLTVLYATSVRPFDEIGLRTAVLAADRAELVLVEPGLPGASARQVAGTLVHVPHRLPALGGADVRDEQALGRAVRGFLR
ncbi:MULTISPECIES: hypothetical protein [unclassified Streptomyces]|uniref:hypothetical protein n=1 Tax=unclassified Streptomyces TaxID=2593676 RepID=UPI0036E517F4